MINTSTVRLRRARARARLCLLLRVVSRQLLEVVGRDAARHGVHRRLTDPPFAVFFALLCGACVVEGREREGSGGREVSMGLGSSSTTIIIAATVLPTSRAISVALLYTCICAISSARRNSAMSSRRR